MKGVLQPDGGLFRHEMCTRKPPVSLESFSQGVIVAEERIPLLIASNEVNRAYRRAKAGKMGHILTLDAVREL